MQLIMLQVSILNLNVRDDLYEEIMIERHFSNIE